jgi:hypothetical protein
VLAGYSEAQCFSSFRRGRAFIRGTAACRQAGTFAKDARSLELHELFGHPPATGATALTKRAARRRGQIQQSVEALQSVLSEWASDHQVQMKRVTSILDRAYYQALDFLLFGAYAVTTGAINAMQELDTQQRRIRGISSTKSTLENWEDSLAAETTYVELVQDEVEGAVDVVAAAVALGCVGGPGADPLPNLRRTQDASAWLEQARLRIADLPCWGNAIEMLDSYFVRSGYDIDQREQTIHPLFRSCFGRQWFPHDIEFVRSWLTADRLRDSE